MAFLFKQKDIYYISVSYKGRRIKKTLGTKSKRVAERIKNKVEQDIIMHMISGKEFTTHLPKTQIIKKFIESRGHCTKSTINWYARNIDYYFKNGLPENPTSRSMVIRAVNTLHNWANKQKYTHKIPYIEGGSVYPARTRVFNKKELNLILNKITPPHFQEFVRFLYYTGARHGEVRNLSVPSKRFIKVKGKTGVRTIMLNSQAREIDINFNYTKDYICRQFNRCMKRFGIEDARPHDLRRTFGLNLIKQGMGIYKVSKLLGHSSVSTTEKHYAPLLVRDVEEFIL